MKRISWKTGAVAGMLCAGLALAGCAGQAAKATDEPSPSTTPEPAAQEQTHTATLHRGYAAAHGDKAFTQIVVATDENGTILAASIDDYQFMAADSAGLEPVPNSDAGFGEGYAEGKTLVSKADNNTAYSKSMMEKGGATQEWLASIEAIESYAVGKSASDLASVSGPDAVSGATLVDTANYLKAVGEVAKSNDFTAEGTYTGDGSDLKIGRVNAAAHGDKAFADAVALVQGSTIVAVSIDEFQFMAADTAGLVPVPNSDAGFGEGYAEGKMLASKSYNNAAYSKSLAEKGGSTQEWLTSMQAIQSFVAGKTAGELGSVSGPDAVSGATLVDTAGYVKAAVEAAQAA